jgi:hypothetical protein
VLVTSSRYGGGEARLGIEDITRLTGLATRTVKGALAELLTRGLLVRIGRTRRLTVSLRDGSRSAGVVPRHEQKGHRRTAGRQSGAAEVPHPPRQPGFSFRQQSIITAVLAEARELLGEDPRALDIPAVQAERCGFSALVTYGDAYEQLSRSATPGQAAAFTRAVLALRLDERIQGQDFS